MFCQVMQKGVKWCRFVKRKNQKLFNVDKSFGKEEALQYLFEKMKSVVNKEVVEKRVLKSCEKLKQQSLRKKKC